MQHRSQSVFVQVCLALAAALVAGFSGDMQARTPGHGSHHARHTRGHSTRSGRVSGRDTLGDHGHELDVRQGPEIAAQAPGSANAPVNAVLAPAVFLPVHFTVVGTIGAPVVGFASGAERMQLRSRAPPSLS